MAENNGQNAKWGGKVPPWFTNVIMACVAVAGISAPLVTNWFQRQAMLDRAVDRATEANQRSEQNKSELNTISGTIGSHEQRLSELEERGDKRAGKIEQLLEGQAAIKATLDAMRQRMDRGEVGVVAPSNEPIHGNGQG